MSKTQKELFLEGEANRWFQKNIDYDKENRGKYNKFLITSINKLPLKPKRVLEVGCSAGWWLNAINQYCKSDCYGIDPSHEAIEFGKRKFPNITLFPGTANQIPFKDKSFDLVMFNYTLCYCDTEDLLKIAHETDRVLNSVGAVVIMDFYSDALECKQEGKINRFSMDFSKMFSWHPAYSVTYSECITDYDAEDREDVFLLLKG